MSVIGHDAAPRPRGTKLRVWRRVARALRRLDRTERYSPILCVTTLLIVGLLVKSAPIIHASLAHN
jgi:hypothetical protein